jgi:hypothetical protein
MTAGATRPPPWLSVSGPTTLPPLSRACAESGIIWLHRAASSVDEIVPLMVASARGRSSALQAAPGRVQAGRSGAVAAFPFAAAVQPELARGRRGDEFQYVGADDVAEQVARFDVRARLCQRRREPLGRSDLLHRLPVLHRGRVPDLPRGRGRRPAYAGCRPAALLRLPAPPDRLAGHRPLACKAQPVRVWTSPEVS